MFCKIILNAFVNNFLKVKYIWFEYAHYKKHYFINTLMVQKYIIIVLVIHKMYFSKGEIFLLLTLYKFCYTNYLERNF